MATDNEPMNAAMDRIKAAAEAEGYEAAHTQESWGDSRFFGLAIFVKMSERKLNWDRDSSCFYEVANKIVRDLGKVSAELDPEGPAKRESYRAEIEQIYRAAGVTAIYMEPLPNGYCLNPCCMNKPWFRVTSRIGHVVIGWRKSVISIDWKDSIIKVSGETVSPDNVTRWETGIHAHGRDATARYIQRLHEMAP